jgi:hypothetical protein
MSLLNYIQVTDASRELAVAIEEVARKREGSWSAAGCYLLTIEQAAEGVSYTWRSLVVTLLYNGWNEALAWANAVKMATLAIDQEIAVEETILQENKQPIQFSTTLPRVLQAANPANSISVLRALKQIKNMMETTVDYDTATPAAIDCYEGSFSASLGDLDQMIAAIK